MSSGKSTSCVCRRQAGFLLVPSVFSKGFNDENARKGGEDSKETKEIFMDVGGTVKPKDRARDWPDIDVHLSKKFRKVQTYLG